MGEWRRKIQIFGRRMEKEKQDNIWRKNIFGHERTKKVKKENIYDIIKRILTYHRYVKKLFRFGYIVIWRYSNTSKYPILVQIEQ